MPFQKQLLLVLGCIFSTFFSIAEQHSDIKTTALNDSLPYSSPTEYSTQNKVPITDAIINYGKLFLNKPYRSGSSGADAFDCSGFTSFVYRNFGYALTHSSSAQAQQFASINTYELKKGDLVYYSGRSKSRNIGHVGIVTEATEDGKFSFIHATYEKGVTISNSEEDYYKKRFVKANRVIDGDQLIAQTPVITENAEAPIQTDANVQVEIPTKKIKKTIPAKIHRVKSGETLSEIAEKYGLTVSELKRKNGLKGTKLALKQPLIIKNKETYTVLEPVKFTSNKLNIAANKSDQKPAQVPSEVTTHTVAKGESLFSISHKYGLTLEEIKKINQIENGQVNLGQVLNIKPLAQNVLNNSENKPVNQPKNISHTVISGETLYSVAKMYNCTMDELKKLNNLPDYNVQLGQTLVIQQLAEKIAQKNAGSTKLISSLISTKTEAKPIEKQEIAPKRIDITEVKTEVKTNLKPDVQAQTASTPTPRAVSRPTSAAKIIVHKVHTGENLMTIARDFKVSIDELKRINNLEGIKLNTGQEIFILLNPDALVVTPVVIPSAPKAEVPEQNNVTTSVTAKPSVVSKPVVSISVAKNEAKETIIKPEITEKSEIHSVKRRETLNTIAENYHLTVNELKKLNNLTNNRLSIGQKLKVTKVLSANNTNELAVLAPTSATASVKSYTVKKGDNLNSIAKDVHISVDHLKQLNGLTNNNLNVGQELQIAHSATDLPAKQPSEKKEAVNKVPAKTITYKVKKGDNLSSIANDFNMTTQELKEINDISNNKIHTGQHLIVSQLSSEKENKPKAEQKSKIIHHKVKQGDSYYSIAQKYDCTVNQLKEWNKHSSTKLSIGDQVIVHTSKN